MAEPVLSLETEPSAADVDRLREGLTEHAAAFVERPGFRPIALLARTPEGRLVGGAYGHLNWSWLDVSLLWVAEDWRGTGLGARLLLGLEEAGRQRGCRHAHLDTFSYQARPFYEAHGYEVFAELEDYPPGHRRFFLRKALAAKTEEVAVRHSDHYRIRALRPGEEVVACRLILDSFHEFEANGYSAEGLTSFTAYADPLAMAKRAEAGDHFALLAEVVAEEEPLDAAGQIVGVIEMRNLSHVSQLFVHRRHHRRGLARALFEQALSRCRARRPDLEKVTVASSRYAVDVYRRLGFVPTALERTERGIRHTPMELRLDKRR